MIGEKGGLAFNRRILVPKTMITGNSLDKFTRLALVTSLEGERYQAGMVAELLGYEDTLGITHDNIPTEELIGRKRGECSVLLDTDNLNKFAVRVFSRRLHDELGRKSALVAYCLGGRYYFCADSIEFRNAYDLLVGKVIIDNRFTK